MGNMLKIRRNIVYRELVDMWNKLSTKVINVALINSSEKQLDKYLAWDRSRSFQDM